MQKWNPWHGCQKVSEGCKNCYVYRIDARHGRDASVVSKTKDFDLPLKYGRAKKPKLAPGGVVAACFTSDFFLPAADEWRKEAWRMMKIRQDLDFFIITKRIDRFEVSLPPDWGREGYPNVVVACTVENQKMADYRLPVYRALPIRNKEIICAPLLGPIDLSKHLGPWAECLSVGGESGTDARPCDFAWVLDLRRQCVEAGVAFNFHQTGAYLIKDGKKYFIKKSLQHEQAKKAAINWRP